MAKHSPNGTVVRPNLTSTGVVVSDAAGNLTMRPRFCTHCGNTPVHARGLCRSCYQYEYRNGKPRPWGLITAAGQRRLEHDQGF
jgi:hypothetical protein